MYCDYRNKLRFCHVFRTTQIEYIIMYKSDGSEEKNAVTAHRKKKDR